MELMVSMLAVGTVPSGTPMSCPKSINACSKFASGINVFCAKKLVKKINFNRIDRKIFISVFIS
jgi:hypothetical protein